MCNIVEHALLLHWLAGIVEGVGNVRDLEAAPAVMPCLAAAATMNQVV